MQNLHVQQSFQALLVNHSESDLCAVAAGWPASCHSSRRKERAWHSSGFWKYILPAYMLPQRYCSIDIY